MPTEWLNVLLLAGILLTPIFSIFRAGRWVQGLVVAVEHTSKAVTAMGQKVDTLKAAFDEHTVDEVLRFNRIEQELQENSKAHAEIRKHLPQTATMR